MRKIWHISDVHLSMDRNMEPIKKMHERRWAIGSWTFTGYLEAMKEFAEANIKKIDIVFITGDILHDMSEKHIMYSLEWLREIIPCQIVICRGNHDKKWRVGRVKLNLNLPRFHIMSESEITQLGPFTIGCYSDHAVKTGSMEEVDKKQVQFALEVAKAANNSSAKTPIMIGHYPVSVPTAELIGEAGIKAYMSGHVHCTNGDEPDAVNGVYWKWYDLSAGLTDDKTFNKCFFSTGTVDVLRAKHGQPFKEIKQLQQFISIAIDAPC